MRWNLLLLIVVYWLSNPDHVSADTSLPIPRTSSEIDAQLVEETLYLKEETVSIASRYEQPLSRAPSDVYVITDEDIRNSGATDIPTLLRRVPGMEVMQTNAVDFNVSVRGNNQLHANKLLVLVDGRSVYLDQSGQVFWKLLPVSLTEIKRIEVLKGPASAVYGFNAFDGVVNIITKNPEDLRGSTLQLAGGELGTLLANGVHAGTVGDWGYRVSGGHEQNQRWSDKQAPSLNTQRFGSMAEYQLSHRERIRAEAGLSRANPYNGFATEANVSDTHFSQAHGVLTYENTGLLVRGSWNGLFSKTTPSIYPVLAPLFSLTDRSGRTDQDFSFNTYDFESRYLLTLLDALKINVGANFRHINLSSNILSNRTAQNRLGLYAQGDWQVSPALEVSAGLRYDLATFGAPALSPRGALVYHVTPDHALRFSGSVACRPPTTIEAGLSLLNPITLSPGQPPLNTVVLGSTDVLPEQIISYEVGYQGWWWKHRLRTRVTGFFNHISDLIAFRNPSGNPANPSRPMNGGIADVYGGEAGIELLLTSWLSGFTNYAYQEIGQTSNGFSRRGFPPHKINAGFRVTQSPFTGEILYHYVGAASYPLADAFTNLAPLFPAGAVLPGEHVSAYNLLNLRLGYLIWKELAPDYSREAELAMSVFNALNDQHREHPLGDLLGTRVLGWVTVKL